jgi:DNA-binding MarR family transcriptional regulator
MGAPTQDIDIPGLAEALRPALLRASRQLRREAQRAGASALDALLLGLIKKKPGIGVSELADQEQMAKPTMSIHIKRLEEAGWLIRDEASAEDRRRVGIRLTALGAKALEAIRRRRNDWLAGRLAALSPQDREALLAAAEPLLRLAGDR